MQLSSFAHPFGALDGGRDRKTSWTTGQHVTVIAHPRRPWTMGGHAGGRKGGQTCVDMGGQMAVYVRAVYVRAVYMRAVYVRAVYMRAVYVRAVYMRAVYMRAFYMRAVYMRAVYVRAVYVRAVYMRAVYVRAVYVRAVYRQMWGLSWASRQPPPHPLAEGWVCLGLYQHPCSRPRTCSRSLDLFSSEDRRRKCLASRHIRTNHLVD
jgi:hypothetical protein